MDEASSCFGGVRSAGISRQSRCWYREPPVGLCRRLRDPPYIDPGAILLTGYLGGEVAANVRVSDPLFETTFPVIFGVLTWAGIFLHDDRLRTLIPLRR
jgi:hypothetical protein